MKGASANLAAEFRKEVASYAMFYRVTRSDGVVMGFSDHDMPLTIDGVWYEAEAGMSGTAIRSMADLAADNMEVSGVITSDRVTARDLLGGRYDYARVKIFMANPRALADGIIQLPGFRIGSVSVAGVGFSADLLGIGHQFDQEIVEITSPGCRYDLGDARCTKSIAHLIESSSVESAPDRRVFFDSARAEAAGYWRAGRVLWTTGENAGLIGTIKESSLGQIELMLPMSFDIAPGDDYDIEPGCDKTIEACADVYDNVPNFGGEPHVPGPMRALAFRVPPP